MIAWRPMIALATVALAAACGDSPTEPTPATRVVIVSASVAYNAGQARDEVTVHLRNEGGAGSYVLELWALPSSPGGAPRVATMSAVSVTADYDETLIVGADGLTSVQTVKVKSRPLDSAAFTQTDCQPVRSGTSYCP